MALSGRGAGPGVASARPAAVRPWRVPALGPALPSPHGRPAGALSGLSPAPADGRRAVAAAPRAAGRRTFVERVRAPRDPDPSERAPPPPLPKLDRASVAALRQLPVRQRLAVVKGLREQAALREAHKRGRKARAAEGRRRAVRGPLHLAGGAYAGTRLWTPDDPATRPMMAKVRAAIFDALAARGCFDVAGRAVAEAFRAWGEAGAVGAVERGGDGAAAGGGADDAAAPWSLSASAAAPVLAPPSSRSPRLPHSPSSRSARFPPPPSPRSPPLWLDLFAGTGAVGLEALSRGFSRLTAVEMDPWVARRCLEANARLCGREGDVAVVAEAAEAFLARAGSAGLPPFDGISVCPPYDRVSYPELFDLLERSGLAHSKSYVIVEYPKRKRAEIPERLGGLERIFDRKYGRTLVAIFGPDQ